MRTQRLFERRSVWAKDRPPVSDGPPSAPTTARVEIASTADGVALEAAPYTFEPLPSKLPRTSILPPIVAIRMVETLSLRMAALNINQHVGVDELHSL